jgi:glycosyltransferase involved in cell wall biosynthesis
MKLLVTTSQWFPDFAGGSGRVAAETALRLAARGHEVTVIAPRHADAPPITRDQELAVHRVLARSTLPSTLTDIAGTWRAARSLRRHRFDLVVAHQTTGAVGALAAAMGAPLALVYHASAVRELWSLRASLKLGAKLLATYPLATLLRRSERIAIARATCTLVLSDFSKSLISQDHPRDVDRVVRVPGGVDVDRFSPLADARERLALSRTVPLLVTARRLEPRYPIDVVLRALLHTPEANLVVIGTGSSERRLRRLARTLGVDTRTRFLGRLGDEDLRMWYSAADVVVMPTAAHEGFGLATAEALACGTPVAAMPLGAAPELLGPLDPALVASNTSSEALAVAIGHALSNGGEDLRALCREYAVGRFAWDTVIPEWERALEEVAGSKMRMPAAA